MDSSSVMPDENCFSTPKIEPSRLPFRSSKEERKDDDRNLQNTINCRSTGWLFTWLVWWTELVVLLFLVVLNRVDSWKKKTSGSKSTKTHWQPNQTCTQRSKAKIKVCQAPSHLRFRTRLLFWGRSRKSMRKSIRAWVSFDVNPWMRPKKVSVSLMVNSLYSARSCQVGKTHRQWIRFRHQV